MNRIYLSPPYLVGNEQKYVNDAINANWIAPVGPDLNKFEKDLSRYHLQSPVTLVSSGTAAMHLALMALGIEKGDVVICSSFTFAGSCFPINYLNAQPIFVESEATTWNMSPEFLRQAIESSIAKGKKPKAIILVHLYGVSAKIEEILEISAEFNIPLVEDAAESLGTKYKDQPLGCFGDFGILSFNGNKIITTSGGGAIICKKQSDKDKVNYWSNQSKSNLPYYHHQEVGYNYRLSNISAAIGRAQFENLDIKVNNKRNLFKLYCDAFDDEVTYPVELNNSFSNRWLSVFDFKRGEKWRDELIYELNNNNIESRPLWKPMHTQPIYEKCDYFGDQLSVKLFNSGLCLPSGAGLNYNEQEKIISIIENKL